MNIASTDISSEFKSHISETILAELFITDDLGRKKLTEEYKILLLNSKCKLKSYFAKNIIEQKIVDIECHCYKLSSFEDKQKFVDDMACVDPASYVSKYIVVTFDKNTYYYFLFIAKLDVSYDDIMNSVSKIKTTVQQATNSFESELVIFSNKMKSQDEKIDASIETLSKKIDKILLVLTKTQEDVDDLLQKCFPNGRDKILM